MRFLKWIYGFTAGFAILILLTELAIQILPRGDLKRSISTTISISEYMIDDLIYRNNPYIIALGALVILILLVMPEKKLSN